MLLNYLIGFTLAFIIVCWIAYRHTMNKLLDEYEHDVKSITKQLEMEQAKNRRLIRLNSELKAENSKSKFIYIPTAEPDDSLTRGF